MITEDYISFETAKLLKEKGFDERIDACYAVFCEYEDDIRVLNLNPRRNAQTLKDGRYPFVTQQLVLKWLREIHHLFISIDWYSDGCEASIYNTETMSWEIRMLGSNCKYSYEETIEAAIKYTLENLI